MAGKSISSRVRNLEKAMKKVNIKAEKLDEKFEKLTEMEKTLESLNQGLARVLSAIEDANKRAPSPGMYTPTENFNWVSPNSRLILSDKSPTEDLDSSEESPVIYRSSESSKKGKLTGNELAQDYLLDGEPMVHQHFIHLRSYPDLGPRKELLKIKGKVKDKEVVVLIKRESSHNYVSKRLVQELGLPLSETMDYMVITDVTGFVGDSMCMHVTVELPGLQTVAHFVPLELVDGIDIMLGGRWIDTLENNVIFYQAGRSRMKFNKGNDIIEWVADPNL